MKRCTASIGWSRYDPRYYRFAMPNAVWEYRLKPVEFVIFSYLCYHRAPGVLTPKTIAVSVHMTVGTVKKYLGRLVDKKLINEDGTPVLCCMDEKFFTLPNEIFLLHLPPSAFLVYAYLLLIEDRQSHTCHPSYNTIAATTGLSRNTTIKSVGALLEINLIAVEPSSYFDRHGLKWKGNNLYTILPVCVAMDAFCRRQIQRLEASAARQKAQAKLSQLCAAQMPSLEARQPTTPSTTRSVVMKPYARQEAQGGGRGEAG